MNKRRSMLMQNQVDVKPNKRPKISEKDDYDQCLIFDESGHEKRGKTNIFQQMKLGGKNTPIKLDTSPTGRSEGQEEEKYPTLGNMKRQKSAEKVSSRLNVIILTDIIQYDFTCYWRVYYDKINLLFNFSQGKKDLTVARSSNLQNLLKSKLFSIIVGFLSQYPKLLHAKEISNQHQSSQNPLK